MCGIAGVLARTPQSPSLADARGMAAALLHRGPDETRVVQVGRAALASTRLAIVDVANSHQPRSTAGGRFTVCLNGEIFNYRELRDRLKGQGVQFETAGDTEVVLHAVATWGPAAFAEFNGQFAVAVYDAADDRLLLARDRYGISPLFWTQRDGEFAFASELECFQTTSAFAAPGLDLQALVAMYLCWGMPAGTSTLQGVRQVDPGCYLSIGAQGVQQHPYWSPRFEQDRPGPGTGEGASSRLSPAQRADLVQEVRGALEAAVQLRLADEVPMAVLLSGGLDSSIVTGLVAGKAPLNTYGISFANPEYDESQHQQAVAQHFGADHRMLRVDTPDLIAELPEVVAAAGMPLTRLAPASTYALARMLREQGIKVGLTGEGADEMFLGYDIFKATAAAAAVAAGEPVPPGLDLTELPQPERSPGATRAGFERPEAQHPCFSHLPRWQAGQRIGLYLNPELTALSQVQPYVEGWSDAVHLSAGTGASPLRRAQALELLTFLPTMLLGAQSDRMLMAHSIEGRYPFLDNTLVDVLAQVPVQELAPGGGEKQVLREAVAGLLPASVATRRKQAYTAPLGSALALPGATPLLDQFTSSQALDALGLFAPTKVAWLRRQLTSPRGITGEDARALLFILTTQMLHDRLIVNRSSLSRPEPTLSQLTITLPETPSPEPALVAAKTRSLR